MTSTYTLTPTEHGTVATLEIPIQDRPPFVACVDVANADAIEAMIATIASVTPLEPEAIEQLRLDAAHIADQHADDRHSFGRNRRPRAGRRPRPPTRDTSGLPTIEATGADPRVVDQALDAMARHCERVYSRGADIVKVVRRPALDGSGRTLPAIVRLDRDGVRDLAWQAARWRVPDRRSRDGLRDDMPPAWLPPMILARAAWPFPSLRGITKIPLLRASGEIRLVDGYDEVTGMVLDLDGHRFEPIDAIRDRESAAKAAHEILEHLGGDFPYREPSDRASLLGAFLTLIGRYAIDGPTPIWLVRSPTRGSGKTLAAKSVAAAAFGIDPPMYPLPVEDDECRKALFSAALAGDAILIFDNIGNGRSFGGPSLAMAATTTFLKDRVLGASKNEAVPWSCVLFATGNNTRLTADLARRVFLTDLDPQCELPEDRPAKSFRHVPLIPHVLRLRGRLVMLGLGILSAYLRAGQPRPGDLRSAGGYEAWCEVVQGAVAWATGVDILAGRDRLRLEGDDEDQDAARALFTEWYRAFGSAPTSVAQLCAASRRVPEGALAAALAAFDRKGTPGEPNQQSVGKGIAALRGKRVVVAGEERGGIRHVLTTLRQCGTSSGSHLWRLQRDEGDTGVLGDISPTPRGDVE